MLKILPEAMEHKYLSWASPVYGHGLQEEHCHHLHVTLKQGTVTHHLLNANGVKTLCTSSARSQGKPSPEEMVLDWLTESVKLLQESIKN